MGKYWNWKCKKGISCIGGILKGLYVGCKIAANHSNNTVVIFKTGNSENFINITIQTIGLYSIESKTCHNLEKLL